MGTLYFGITPLLLLILSVSIAYFLIRRGRLKDPRVRVLIPTILAYLAVIVVQGRYLGRYLVPIIPLIMIVCSSQISYFLSRFNKSPFARRSAVFSLAILCAGYLVVGMICFNKVNLTGFKVFSELGEYLRSNGYMAGHITKYANSEYPLKYYLGFKETQRYKKQLTIKGTGESDGSLKVYKSEDFNRAIVEPKRGDLLIYIAGGITYPFDSLDFIIDRKGMLREFSKPVLDAQKDALKAYTLIKSFRYEDEDVGWIYRKN